MSILKPFKRTCRQSVNHGYSEGGQAGYIEHCDYADSPEKYIRAFLLIQNDFIKLFEYIEPSQKNLNCYSFRIHELLLRTCVEIEANFKAILLENGYPPSDFMRIDSDYFKVNKTHHLSSYSIELPYWQGKGSIRKPFVKWKNGYLKLKWYDGYNKSKHDRHNYFEYANFENLIDAIAGLAVILSAQFHTSDFQPGSGCLLLQGPDYAIGDYFKVNFPNDWGKDEKYDFEWQDLKDRPDPIQKYNYQK